MPNNSEIYYKDGSLYVENVQIEEIANEIPTPFYCYSQSNIERKFLAFKDAMETNELEGTICFAVKANSNLAIVRTLKDLGAGADTVSKGEIALALKAGIPAHKIVFSGVGKSKEDLTFAVSNKIRQINIESYSEAQMLDQITKTLGIKTDVAVRINPDVDAKTHAKISTGSQDNKFGICWSEARTLYEEMKAMEYVNPVGIDMHVGSQLTSITPFEETFEKASEMVKYLRQIGVDIKTIDVGGGLGVRYQDSDNPPSMDEYMFALKKTVGDLKTSFIFEPGRCFVGEAGILVTKVIHLKQTPTKLFAFVDAGMNDLVRVAMYDAYHDIIPVIQDKKRKQKKYDVAGPICESSDIFVSDRSIQELFQNDLVVLKTAGAYGSSMASNYNSRSIPAEVLVKKDHFTVIRRAQTLEEMLALQSLAPWQE